ncbi:MAG: hydrogenase [Denitrovibrio sp.]|nr:MAG: hydrogenase [Denitrovibrio sp.]
MKKTRRDFLKSAAVGSAFLATPFSLHAQDLKANDEAVGMLYDSTLCVGCKACVTRCKQVNDMAAVDAPNDGDRIWDSPVDLDYRTRNIIKLYKEDEKYFAYVKHQCMHCIKPACVSACPVSAMQKEDERGIVFYDKNKCIGCRYCQVACAFNIPKFEWPESYPKIVKCDLCKFTNLKLKNEPACCETCPTGAVIYGKRKDLLAEAKNRLVASPAKYTGEIYGEHEVGGTNVLYLAGTSFQNLGFAELEHESAAMMSEHIQHTLYKGFIAPVALYGFLALVALKNRKSAHQVEEQKKVATEIVEKVEKDGEES